MKTFASSAPAALCALAALLPASQAWAIYGASVHADSVSNGGYYQTFASASFSNANVDARASADVYAGALHAYAGSSNNPHLPAGCAPYDLHCNWGTAAQASLWETITLTRSTATSANSLNYAFSMDGSKTPGKWWSWNDAQGSFYFGTDSRGWTKPRGLTGTDSSVSGTITAPVGESITVYFYESIYVLAQGGAVTDYSNTMKFNWALPEGWTYTSESGRFMTSAVPEPTSLSLTLAGLVLLCGKAATRERRRTNLV